MKEYIEREAALRALARYRQGFQFMEAKCVVEGCMSELTVIRPADVVERKRGEWEAYFDGKYLMCSACKASFWDEDGNGGSNFCPDCGADMREAITDEHCSDT